MGNIVFSTGVGSDQALERFGNALVQPTEAPVLFAIRNATVPGVIALATLVATVAASTLFYPDETILVADLLFRVGEFVGFDNLKMMLYLFTQSQILGLGLRTYARVY